MEKMTNTSVLFVDDEVDILDVLEKEFRFVIEKIFLASQPEEALKIVAEQDLDLVVLDFKMPKMNGLTLYQEMKKIKPLLPCIFLSGHGDKSNIQQALRLGALNFVDKPFDPKHLEMAIDRVIEKARSEKLLRELLELFLLNYTKLDIAKFDSLPYSEREKTIRAALGLAKIQILNRTRE